MAEEEPEHMERIPWGELLPQPRSERSWVTYAVIGALVVAALILALTRRQVVAPTVTLALPVSASPAATAAPLSVPDLPAISAPLYSEADLMAVMPQVEHGWVAGRAEWFIRDYFTVAGESDDWSQALRHLPEGAIQPGMRPPTGASYVEWARTIDVQESTAGEFEALVAFQLVIPDGDSYRRQPVRAVTVRLALDEAGVAAVRDIPSPAPLQFGQVSLSWGQEAEPPPAVAASALERTLPWGGDAEILTAARTAEGWRLVLAVRDEGGNTWPLAVAINDSGG